MKIHTTPGLHDIEWAAQDFFAHHAAQAFGIIYRAYVEGARTRADVEHFALDVLGTDLSFEQTLDNVYVLCYTIRHNERERART